MFLFETYQMLAEDFDSEEIIAQIIKEEKLNEETAIQDVYIWEQIMGFRSLRISLMWSEFFCTQLRALYQ